MRFFLWPLHFYKINELKCKCLLGNIYKLLFLYCKHFRHPSYRDNTYTLCFKKQNRAKFSLNGEKKKKKFKILFQFEFLVFKVCVNMLFCCLNVKKIKQTNKKQQNKRNLCIIKAATIIQRQIISFRLKNYLFNMVFFFFTNIY